MIPMLTLLPTLEIMKERRYDLYRDAKCRFCLTENEDEDHIIYCQQLKDKWITIANNTVHQYDQVLTNFITQEKQIQIQLNQKDIQQLHLWNRNFFKHTIGINYELPISFVHLLLRNFFPKGKYKELKNIVKSKKIALTIATLYLEVFTNEFHNIIWQPCCKIIAEWEQTKGIKKQEKKRRLSSHKYIKYNRTLTTQIEEDTYDLKGRKILKHNEQWSIALEKSRQYINKQIRERNKVAWKRVVKAYTEAICYNDPI
ncbi:hypothetical protein RclHR1_11290004 [Rhizophagus clarus]|uniref:Uncharacterized protein n=1 Tax=Rhizophagus clarus TaxID=94130 RepID=A0A2Z6Q3X5_9GLOM|nr:hypothetical protein RclHR1_11290004 [Rhizophagus clarus]